MQTSWTTLVSLLFLALPTIQAFQFAAGTACTGTGACTYEYFLEETNEIVNVQGFCAPSGICAANGATCTADEQCFNYCGFTSGTCGGLGALCNSQEASDPAGQSTVTCNTPFAVCSEADEQGVCVLPASSGSRARMRARAKRAADMNANARPLRHAVIRRNV